MKPRFQLKSLVVSLLASYIHSPCVAQVLIDNSLGQDSSIVHRKTKDAKNSDITIQGGAIRGANLFHSFTEFSIKENHRVDFDSPQGVARIFARITGNKSSRINGTIGVLGNSDFFLINPNGISFGIKSALDVSGAFLVTTGDSILFENGFQYSSSKHSGQSLLTVSAPNGIVLSQNPARIEVKSQPILFDASGSFLGFGLYTQPNQSFSLLGGDILFEGGNVYAPNGNIELAAVDEFSQVGLKKQGNQWKFLYDNVQGYKDIILRKSDTVLSPQPGFPLVVTFNGDRSSGGSIDVVGKRILLQDGAQINGFGSRLLIEASELVDVSGTGPAINFRSSINSFSPLFDKPGTLEIKTKNLSITDGGKVSTETTGFFRDGQLINPTSDAGDIKIKVEDTLLIQGNKEKITGINSRTESFGSAGSVTIQSNKLILQDTARISVESPGIDTFDQPLSTGSAGKIEISAKTAIIDNNSLLNAATINGGGNISVIADTLALLNRGKILTNASQEGSGGDISLGVSYLLGLNNSDITANSLQGTGGNISISASNGIIGFVTRTFQDITQILPEDMLDSQLLETNDITAFSQQGGAALEGNISIAPLNTNPSERLSSLPNVVFDASIRLDNACSQSLATEKNPSSLVITGRERRLDHTTKLVDQSLLSTWISTKAIDSDLPTAKKKSRDSEFPKASTSSAVTEARSWHIASTGDIVLTIDKQHKPYSNIARAPQGCLKS